MTDKVTIASFRDVLNRYLHIADHDYKGHVHDNVLNIFNDMTEEEQKSFLRGVIHIHSVVVGHIDDLPKRQSKPKGVESTRDLRSEDKDPDEDDVVEYINTRQKMAMRMWLTKATAVTILFFVCGLFTASFFSANNIQIPFLESIGGIGKVVNKVLGFGL